MKAQNPVMEFSQIVIVAMPLLGAVLPLLVTQISSDAELKAIGRAVIKYAVALPALLAIVIFGIVDSELLNADIQPGSRAIQLGLTPSMWDRFQR